MPFKIHNWKLTFLTILFISLFSSLGIWQLSRATEKQRLLDSFTKRTTAAPLNVAAMAKSGDWRFYPATIEGSFDNAHSILLDNKIQEGKVGYEVYTPFIVKGLTNPILIDRGFTPMTTSRKVLPAIHPIIGNVTITGLLNLPPAYVALGQMTDSTTYHWPLRVQYINLHDLSALLNNHFYPYILSITPNDPAAYEVKWQVVTMGPEKHRGYALQWFAFALTLLILFVALNRHKKN